MGTSFVAFEENGFWMEDSLLALWLRLAALHIRCGANDEDALTRLRNGWMLHSQSWGPGVVIADLDAIAHDAVAKAGLITAIRSTQTLLADVGTEIQPGILNLLGVEPIIWTMPIKTAGLQEIASAFIDLLEGRIDAKANSMEFMPGSRT
jgi:hypothetical protein